MWIMWKDWDNISARWKADMRAIGVWIDENLVMPIERLINKFPTIKKFLGLTTRSESEINRLYAGQADAQQPGYILGKDTSGIAAGKALAEQIKVEQGLDAFAGAAPQQVQINGQFNFNNPPEGMSFEQNNRGIPEISTDLGQN
jgi:hypothetical protein